MSVSVVAPGWAMVSCVQVAPFQDRAWLAPIATQWLALVQDSPVSPVPPAPGVVSCVQVAPFQDRARLHSVISLKHWAEVSTTAPPTAMQKDLVGHDTPERWSAEWSPGLGAASS